MQSAYSRANIHARLAAGLLAAGLLMADAASAIEPRHDAASGERDARAATPSSQPASGLDERLEQKGLEAGNSMLIRIFKSEHELEVWLRRDDRFELFATYPICKWSGTLGPKQVEGDKQAPEGFYGVSLSQTHRRGRWPRSMNIGYPNRYDLAMERTGSFILVHGGCTSTGCYAMTDPQMAEIHALAVDALREGQQRIPVHVFPFRMTGENMTAHAGSEWMPFWRDLKAGYDAFERTRLPPAVSVCGQRYVVGEATSADVAGGVPPVPPGCSAVDVVADEVQVQALRSRKLASRTEQRRAPGRNARKAYAAARKARMAAHAERVRAKQASAAARRAN